MIKSPNYGFYGIFGHHDDPDAVWALASEAIAKATGCTAECIKTFLESCKGRLFAQAVIESMPTNALETAVDAAVARWMCLKIRPEDESDYGIQPDLPYLKGFACHCKLEADTGEGWPPHTNSFV
jgi:hypothetical protein